MVVLKLSIAKQIFHDAGAKRVSRKALHAVDDAISKVIKQLAEDVVKVYPNALVEAVDVARVCNITEKYKLSMDVQQVLDIDIERLVKDEPLPDLTGDHDDE